jgi:PAS domain S-box-containing protein
MKTAPNSADTSPGDDARTALDRYETLLNTVNGIVWEADAVTLSFTFVSQSVQSILGYSPKEWLNTPGFWEHHIYHADRYAAVIFCQTQTALLHNHELEYRMVRADGSLIWIRDVVTVIAEDGKAKWLRGIMVDVTETRMMAALEHVEKQVLELNASPGSTETDVLDYYVRGIEELFPHVKCSVLRVSDETIYSWVGPSLPAVYTNALNGLRVGPNQGSCGAAAYLRQLVIASDIATDARWVQYKHLALPHGLQACWSYPIMDSQGNVMATFAIYHDRVATPTASQIAIVERSAAILKIILENRAYTRIIAETNALMAQGQELANLGSWQWNIATNEVQWSDVLYRIYGIADTTLRITYDKYLSFVHPDDRQRVVQLLTALLENGQDAVYEERIVLADSTVRYLRSWARLVRGTDGKPEKMIGACLDVTTLKHARKKMDEIAWMQSHIIRAPLARLMGLVNVLLEAPCTADERDEMLRYIGDSAHELDRVIHDISNHTSF